ncbi:MAG: alpha/beta hydrolase fold domain-containing protein [Sulfitobacter sp.]
MTPPNYRALIDTEMWAFIDLLDGTYPPGVVDMTIVQQRAVYNDMCQVFYQGRPVGVEVYDEDHGGVACRRYQVGPSDVTVIYYHGGGFVVGGLDSHDDVCAEICKRTGYRVISVDYSLAPEVAFPGCFNDAWAAFVAIAAVYDGSVIMCGDSAGGNLAAAVTHHARGCVEGRIAGQVLIYPGLGGDTGQGSYLEHSDAPHLSTADMAFYMKIRAGGVSPPKGDPRFAPLQDTDFSGLPPSVMITAQCDPLASDGEAYRDAMRAAGGTAAWINVSGMVHGCLRARAMSQKAAGFFDHVVSAVDALGRRDWPY